MRGGRREKTFCLCQLLFLFTFSLFFLFCLAFSVSLALFSFLSTAQPAFGGWCTGMAEWVGSPVVLTAPDRAVLMGADDD